jgi:hypothetical protein
MGRMVQVNEFFPVNPFMTTNTGDTVACFA